ncbi:hypothetical protein, partial [Phocaeicola plebeius]|uniref:hypothetical protein n=1 Tax=Phocaeicola plebeius TaxID=310297 RepID=UPI003F9C4FE3
QHNFCLIVYYFRMTLCKVSTVPVYKKKKRLVISGKVILSTSLAVLQYFPCSTPVLQGKYWSTPKGVLALNKRVITAAQKHEKR